MKKLVIVLLIVVVGCSAVFAADLSLGFAQNFMDTYFIADYQGDHFGVEGGIGIPLIYGTASLIGDMADGKDVSILDGIGMVCLPAAMVNGYWKAVDGRVFDLRLGLQGDVFSIITPDMTSVFALWGPSIGFDFTFSDEFSINLTGTLPAALPLNAIGAGDYGAFIFTKDVDEIGEGLAIFFGQLLPGILSEFARLSFKWKV